jgi:type I restriction enzyme S subunit
MNSKTLLDLVELDSLPQSWEVRKLEEVAFINQETTNLKDYSWIHYTDISSVGTRTVEMPSKLEAKDAPSRARRVLRKGDTVISSVRPNRKSFFYFNEEWANAIASTGFAVLSPKNFDDAEYLHAVLTSERAVKIYEAICEGGAYPAFNPSRLNEIRIPWPPQAVRRELGHTVMNLQSKIEMNKALSETLEDLAQTIFKSWFIDFDPVKAKMAGEKPIGMDPTTAALFPNSMEESELGMIPKGWEIRSIESLCGTLLGGTPSRTREEFWGGEIPWINSGKVNDFRITTPSEYITELGLEKSATKLLPKGTTVLAITGATLGQFSRLEISSCANQSVVGIIGSADASNEFVFLTIKNGMQRLISAQTGGAQQHINKEDVNAFRILYPGKNLMIAFTNTVEVMFSEIGVLLNQSISLAEIRDSLLPRLISGELLIPEEMLAS